MKIFLAVTVALMYTVGASIINHQFRAKLDGLYPNWKDSDWFEEPEVTRLKKFNRWVDLGCLLAACIAMCFLVDNWQTGTTLIMIAIILPAFIGSGALKGLMELGLVAIAMLIIWQLPSSQRTEELVVSEGTNLASFVTADGQTTDSLIIEDHGKFILTIDDGPGKIRQETVPAEIVSGCYIDDEASSVATFNYTETYKRTFWSKKCTKLTKRELTAVYLYVKRWQIVNTFSVLRQS